MNNKDSVEVILYSTSACHLCELAKTVFENTIASSSKLSGKRWILDVVDITDEKELFNAYGIRIPVIKTHHRDDDIGWPFDEQALSHYLEQSL